MRRKPFSISEKNLASECAGKVENEKFDTYRVSFKASSSEICNASTTPLPYAGSAA